MQRVLIVIAGAFLFLACGPGQGARLPLSVPGVDAPYQLALDDDLDAQREFFSSLLEPSDKRSQLRMALAKEYVRRLDLALSEQQADAAFDLFGELLTLWSPEELATADLSPFRAQAEALSKRFAKSGGDIEASTALVALALIDRPHASAYLDRVEEIFAYGDELSVSSFGSGGMRARPIEILETVVAIVPSRWAVDRLVSLYRDRQAAISSSFRRKGADMDLLRVHGAGVLNTTRNIVQILIQGGRINEAPAAIAEVTGIGDDATLRSYLSAALASQQAPAWILLASLFRDGESSQQTALSLCQEAIRRDPREALGYIAAGDTAAQLGNISLAIRYLESGLRIDPSQQDASATLASMYEAQVSQLAYSDRPNAALKQLRVFEEFHAAASQRLGKPLIPDLASAYGVMGRGLVSLGDLGAARRYLQRSLKLRPNLRALENLGTIELRQGHFAAASSHYAQALALPVQDLDDTFDRIKIQRLAAEAAAGAGLDTEASALFREALASWRQLLADHELGSAGLAEAFIEIGKSHFQLGNRDEALKYFFRALEKSTGDHANHPDLVCFLLVRGDSEDAYDIYLDAMGNDEVGEYYKIYMSIWLLAEAKRNGMQADHFVTEYLRHRDGELWPQRLAHYAIGQSSRSELEALLTTRGQRAELMYYAAVVGAESRNPQASKELLEEVVKGSMVLFFEYELARARLLQLQ